MIEDILNQVSGLRPQVWLSVGAGFAREDIKSLILSRGRGFVGDAVLNLQEIALKLTGIKKERLLNSFSRQEIFRVLLSDSRVIEQMPEVTRIKRQKNFLRRLDVAFQTARMAFAHSEEEEVYQDRLIQVLGENGLRNELRILSKAYEVWLEASSFLDLPLLLRSSIEVLKQGWPHTVSQPQEVVCLSIQNPESLEREFWDSMGQWVQVTAIRSWIPVRGAQREPSSILWSKWHTLDDAAEEIAEQISLQPEFLLDSCAVLMPDLPVVRRSLKRALEFRNIPLADSRDPTRLKWDEVLKWALLPLEVVASQFERQTVISWLTRASSQSEFADSVSIWVEEINSRGIRRGLKSYEGGLLVDLHRRLQELERELGGRRTCREVGDHFLKVLKSNYKIEFKSDSSSAWILLFLEEVWGDLSEDLDRVGQAERKAPLLLWLERLQSRIRETSPPVDRVKARHGVQIYRLQQAPVTSWRHLWILGLPPQWLEAPGVGSYWLTDREREILSSEFAVRSSHQIREERLEVLKAWIHASDQVTFFDAEYGVDGRERESIQPLLKEIESQLNQPFPSVPQICGAHPRFQKSYGAMTRSDRKVQPQAFKLPPLPLGLNGEVPVLTATALDRMSRCSFQALGFHRWKLSDVREPDTELWPEVRGNLLHEAVRLLLKSMNSVEYRVQKGSAVFSLTSAEALELAWQKKRPKGLIQSRRVEDYVKARLIQVLDVFCEKEIEYLGRSGAYPVSLDDLTIRAHYPKFTIMGQPDRIDQHSEGLFIMDYKTSGTLSHGSEMLEKGYRLQLPFYAVGLQKYEKQPVIGLQFIELDRKGGRKNGIFFKTWNGSQEGSITRARADSKSLVTVEPSEAWKILETFVIHDAETFVDGQFQASPRSALLGKKEQECIRCSLGDLCGFRRRMEKPQ